MALFGPSGRGDRIAKRVILPLLVVFVAIVVPLWIVHFPLRVEGDSMYPTLYPQDRVLVTRGYPSPTLGDIVVVTVSPREGTAPHDQLKRVVAREGQTVSIERGRAIVDGLFETLSPSILLSDSDVSAREQTVPPGYIYVLGDNRPVSLDSRFYGAVPLEAVRGRVTFVVAPITRFGRVD